MGRQNPALKPLVGKIVSLRAPCGFTFSGTLRRFWIFGGYVVRGFHFRRSEVETVDVARHHIELKQGTDAA